MQHNAVGYKVPARSSPAQYPVIMQASATDAEAANAYLQAHVKQVVHVCKRKIPLQQAEQMLEPQIL